MEGWLYQCAGVHIVEGMKQRATNGYIGITDQEELILYDNKGEVFDRAPVKAIEAKFSLMANVLKTPGHKYTMEFHPLSQNIAGAAFGAVGAIAAAAFNKTENDTRSEKEKKNQFVETVKQIQAKG
ncbi:MAG: hypothetical protein FWF33_02195 [Clostridiales bacterium]|nr:hypothetical protein [Clostridiales bacterium]